MRLSVDFCVFGRKLGDFKAIDMIKEAGIECVDFNTFCWPKHDWPMIGDNWREYAHQVREYLDKSHIICNQTHAPYEMCHGKEFSLEESAYFSLVRSMEASSVLGAEYIIVHPLHVPKEVDFEEYNLSYYSSLIPYCEKFNIKVAIENLFSEDSRFKRNRSVPASPEKHCSLIKKLASPYFVACVDVGHAALGGYEPHDYILGVKDHLKALHIHDNDFAADKHALPYTGNIKWDKLVKSLRDADYKGDLTLETITYFNKFPEELLPDALRLAAKVGRDLIYRFENGQ